MNNNQIEEKLYVLKHGFLRSCRGIYYKKRLSLDLKALFQQCLEVGGVEVAGRSKSILKVSVM